MNSKGQVGVVVAILLVTIMVSVLITIQVYYLPQWMKEREAEHMDVVANQFASLKYSLDLQTMAESSSPLTNSITLGSKELPYFASARAFGSMQILPPQTSNFSVRINGSGMISTYQPSIEKSGKSNISNIISIDTFEVYLNSLDDGDFYSAIFPDAFLSIQVWKRADLSNTYQINLSVNNATTTLFDQPVAIGLSDGNDYKINLLDDDYKIATYIIPFLSTPFNMSFNTSAHGKFLIGCNQYQLDDDIYYGGFLGAIQYNSDNAYFVDQNYIYQGGSVILSQSSGNSMLYPLLLTLSNESKSINLTLIDVIGLAGKTGVSGYGTFSIRTNFSRFSQFQCYGTSLTINITTNYPTAWGTYLEDEFKRSGIPSTNIVKGLTFVSVTVYDVTLFLSEKTVYAQMGPGWVT